MTQNDQSVDYQSPRYYGKYRGTVLDNNDPEGLGRLKVRVESIDFEELPNWAEPCTPYAGPQEGFYFMPPLEANVWVEFAEGDVRYPIWSGCFWAQKDDVPILDTTDGPTPLVKVLKTASYTLTLDDTTESQAGSLILTCSADSVKTEAKLTINNEGIKLENSPAVITIKPEESIVVEYPNGKITMKETELQIELSSSIINLQDQVVRIDTTTTNINADTNIDGNETVSGNSDISGNVTVGGNHDVSGNASVTGTGSVTGNLSTSANLSVSANATVSGMLSVS